MIHVKKIAKKPSPEIVKQFAALSSATVHEASGRKGYVDYRIKSLAKGRQGMRSRLYDSMPAR